VAIGAPTITNVVPAKAGTHNHRIEFDEDSWLQASRDSPCLGVWVPAFAGTTVESAAPPPY